MSTIASLGSKEPLSFVSTNGYYMDHSYLRKTVSFVSTNDTAIKRTGNNIASFVDTDDLTMKRSDKESECM